MSQTRAANFATILFAIMGSILACAASAQNASAQDGATSPAEAVRQEAWRAAIAKASPELEGCFVASYPANTWTPTACATAPRRPMAGLAQRQRRLAAAAEQPQTVGNGNDYLLVAPAAVSGMTGSFPVWTGVTSETGANYGPGGGTIANSYTLQLNTGFMQNPTCNRASTKSKCLVWQQFILTTNFISTKEISQIFVQYWLIYWDTKHNTCPAGWMSAGGGDCYKNSKAVNLPLVPVTALGSVQLHATATAGGHDVITLTTPAKAYSVTLPDSVVKLGTSWTQGEFNIFGNANSSEAVFNTGASVEVSLAAVYNSTTAPQCIGAGTTAETVNFNLGTCTASGGANPGITFGESN